MPAPKHVVTDETDDFIQRTTGQYTVNTRGSGTRSSAPPDVSMPLVGPRKRRETPKSIAARIAVALLSVLFLMGGILALISCVGSFMFFEHLFPIAFWPSLAVCIISILIGFFGVATAWKRLMPTSVTTAGFALLVAVYGVGGSVFVLRAASGHSSITATLWNETIASHESSVCNFENFFTCSGWSASCGNASNATQSPSALPSSAPPSTTLPSTTNASTTQAPTEPPTTSAPTPAPSTWLDDTKSENVTNTSVPTDTSHPNTRVHNTTVTPNHTPVAPTSTLAPVAPAAPAVFACARCSFEAASTSCESAFSAFFHDKRIGIVAALVGLTLLSLLLFAAIIVAHVGVRDIRPPTTF